MPAAISPPSAPRKWKRDGTLAFLGDVSAEDDKRLGEKLAEVRVPPFILPVEGIGTFGGATAEWDVLENLKLLLPQDAAFLKADFTAHDEKALESVEKAPAAK